jgi:hypothetical protein
MYHRRRTEIVQEHHVVGDEVAGVVLVLGSFVGVDTLAVFVIRHSRPAARRALQRSLSAGGKGRGHQQSAAGKECGPLGSDARLGLLERRLPELEVENLFGRLGVVGDTTSLATLTLVLNSIVASSDAEPRDKADTRASRGGTYDGAALEGRRAAVKHKDRLDAVEEELVDATEEAQDVRVDECSALLVLHRSLELEG